MTVELTSAQIIHDFGQEIARLRALGAELASEKLELALEIERLTNAIRVARQFLISGGPESIAECDGGAWDAAETLRLALGRAH